MQGLPLTPLKSTEIGGLPVQSRFVVVSLQWDAGITLQGWACRQPDILMAVFFKTCFLDVNLLEG
jgi:hypothetical protein